MATRERNRPAVEVETNDRMVSSEPYEQWVCWPIHWSGVWTGALSALAVSLIFGLAGIALGAHLLGPENRVVDWSKFTITALAFSIGGAFLAFVIGGWVAVRVGGIRRSEPAMLHGAVAWLVAVPLLLFLAGLGAGSFFGGWYGSLAGSPAWASAPATPLERPEPLVSGASAADIAQYQASLAEYQQAVKQWKEDTPKATRNAALGAVTALLLGLVGSVIGGWMASGEPMSFTYYRTRTRSRATGNGV